MNSLLVSDLYQHMRRFSQRASSLAEPRTRLIEPLISSHIIKFRNPPLKKAVGLLVCNMMEC